MPDINDWTTELRREFTQLADTKARIDALLEEYQARGWSGNVQQEDLTGVNADITPTMVSNALGTAAALDTLWDDGHKTNVYSLYLRNA